ncbi:MAG: LPS-assembly protein LptD [Dysgonamonadaceae bacterium]|jgi:hypothetical protein|nr:LPS-assembly protein LptD [Dysgonamonadaceae bacterium]
MIIKSPYCFWICLFFLLSAGQRVIAQETVPVTDSQDSITGINIDNKTDSTTVKTDSIKSNALDAPITATAKDSMVILRKGTNKLFIYGEGTVKYGNLGLEAERIELDADSRAIYATYATDSIGEEFGYPIFKEGEKQYEMKQVWYNFKTRKMYLLDIITQEGEGYLTASTTKKMADDDLFLEDGKYTTCDDHEHPHWYFQITKGKLRPGKNVVVGPTYLVVEDVPLPIAVPFGFFPFSKSYSSGVIMPTYGDEMTRGFSLRDFGYYFAINDYVDLALRGEIYTKGSWGMKADSRYMKKYKFSGNFNASYLLTVTGDKDTENIAGSDYKKDKAFSLNWGHSQDTKANPFVTLSADVRFSTHSFDRNNLESIYSDRYSENTKSSNINYAFRHPTLPVSISANASINQISRDTTLSVTLPNLTISMSQLYPFKRKEQVGDAKWYEKIYMSYSGSLKNSIGNVKEYDFFQKSVIKDWRNGMSHSIPVSASFNLFKYITINPSINYTESWYSQKVDYDYDYMEKKILPSDTTYGFYRVFNYNASVSANTKLYGLYKPWSLFGKWTEGVEIRHVITPTVSFSGAPDFSDPRYGMYKKIRYFNEQHQEWENNLMSPFKDQLFGVPSTGKTGSLSFSLDNNFEMKLPAAAADSARRKVSLIDKLELRTGYNFLKDSMNWDNINASVRLKLFGKSNLSLQGAFDRYLYNGNGQYINKMRKGIGRFMGTSTGYSYNLSNEVVKKWFKKEDEGTASSNTSPATDGADSGEETNNTEGSEEGGIQHASLRKPKKDNSGDFDSDGYLLLDIPWSLNFSYSATLSYDRQNFNEIKREYPYKISQTLGVSGNISPTKGWSINFNTSYDFDYKRFATLSCGISRSMHCWNMSAQLMPIGPYQSYSFTIAVNSNLLRDLKYSQSNNSRDAMNWGY